MAPTAAWARSPCCRESLEMALIILIISKAGDLKSKELYIIGIIGTSNSECGYYPIDVDLASSNDTTEGGWERASELTPC